MATRYKKGEHMNGFIIVDSRICSGKPVIKGTRILEAYPELTREMVQAALEYAAAVIDEEQVIAHA